MYCDASKMGLGGVLMQNRYEWLHLTVSLGALIRNGMGNLVYVFYSLRITFMNFHEYVVGLLL